MESVFGLGKPQGKQGIVVSDSLAARATLPRSVSPIPPHTGCVTTGLMFPGSCLRRWLESFTPGHCSKYTTSPYDAAVPLLGIYPKNPKTLIQKDTCTPMFIATLFTIAKIWKQP